MCAYVLDQVKSKRNKKSRHKTDFFYFGVRYGTFEQATFIVYQNRRHKFAYRQTFLRLYRLF